MSVKARILCCLFCLLTLGIATAPAVAQPAPLLHIDPAILFKTVTVVGAGDTLAAAEAYALAEIRLSYFVFSYTTANPLCSEIQLPQNQTFTLCSIQVTARVIRKATWILP